MVRSIWNKLYLSTSLFYRYLRAKEYLLQLKSPSPKKKNPHLLSRCITTKEKFGKKRMLFFLDFFACRLIFKIILTFISFVRFCAWNGGTHSPFPSFFQSQCAKKLNLIFFFIFLFITWKIISSILTKHISYSCTISSRRCISITL